MLPQAQTAKLLSPLWVSVAAPPESLKSNTKTTSSLSPTAADQPPVMSRGAGEVASRLTPMFLLKLVSLLLRLHKGS